MDHRIGDDDLIERLRASKARSDDLIQQTRRADLKEGAEAADHWLKTAEWLQIEKALRVMQHIGDDKSHFGRLYWNSNCSAAWRKGFGQRVGEVVSQVTRAAE